MNFLRSLGAWTPASVVVIMLISTLMFCLVWYVITNQAIPQWLLTLLSFLASTGIMGVGNTLAISNVKNTVDHVGPSLNGNGHGGNKP